MKFFVSLFLFGLVATSASAEPSLADKAYWKGQNEYMEKPLKAYKEACGKELKFSFDTAKLDKEALKKHGNSPYGLCSGYVENISNLCRSNKDVKTAVAAVTSATCTMGGKWGLAKAGGALTMTISTDMVSVPDYTKKWVMENF